MAETTKGGDVDAALEHNTKSFGGRVYDQVRLAWRSSRFWKPAPLRPGGDLSAMSTGDREMPLAPPPPRADAERSEDPSAEQDTIFDAMIDAYLKPSPEVVARYDEIGQQTCEALARLKSRSDDGSEESVALPVRDV